MHAEHVDVGAVQLGQPFRGQDLVGRASRPAAVDHEQDPVDEPEDRVDVVGHEQDGAPGPRVPAADELGDLALVAQVEVRERLVAQQQLRVADEGLGDPQALLLAARQAPDRGIGVGASPRPRRSRPRPDGRRSRSGRPTPQRWPSSPRRTRSRPRSGRSRSKTWPWGTYPMPGLPRRGGWPRTSTDPTLSPARPSTMRSSEVLPDPLGPRIATKLPSSNASDRSCQTSRPAEGEGGVVEADGRRGHLLTHPSPGPLELVHLGELPLLVGLVLRRDRLGHADDRDAVRDREVVDLLGQRAR